MHDPFPTSFTDEVLDNVLVVGSLKGSFGAKNPCSVNLSNIIVKNLHFVVMENEGVMCQKG